MAIAISYVSIDHVRLIYRDVYKTQHKGLTDEEMNVPLIIIDLITDYLIRIKVSVNIVKTTN